MKKDINLDKIIFLDDDSESFETVDAFETEELGEKENNKSSRKLHTSRQDKAIIDLDRMMKNDEIILSPFFQRKYVWTKKSASKFIESLLINIPIPTIFISENENGIWDVVDGQQRLTAIKLFLNNELPLTGLETLNELNKLYYKDLDEKTKRTLNNSTLSVVIIDNESDEDIKFDIFMRINQGSVKLNEQELRNCLYRGRLMETIQKMGQNSLLLKILRNKESFINRYQHLEIIERFLSISELMDYQNFELKENSYGGRITNSINNFLKKNKNLDYDSLCSLQLSYEDSIKKVYEVFKENSFRQFINNEYNHKINRAVAELQLVTFKNCDFENILEKAAEIKDAFETLMASDKKFADSLVSATNNTSVVNYRYKTWGNKLKSVLMSNEK